jgi:hypothetical protein
MPTIALELLDQRRIAVRMKIGERESVLRGTGRYEVGPEGGGLCIEMQDAGGVSEIQLRERDWDGNAAVDTRFGCDYCVELSSPG